MLKPILKKTALYRFYINRKIEASHKREIENNKRIRGPLIDRYLPKNGVGAELGVLKGNFSRVLLDFSAARELHLIDPWYFLDSDWSWAGGNTSTVDAVCKILTENKKDIKNNTI